MTKEQHLQHLEKMSRAVTGEVDYDNHWQVLKSMCDIAKPKNILELGFNRGSSCLMFLYASEAQIHSIDILPEIAVQSSLEEINKHFGDRFKYTTLDHKDIGGQIDNFKDKYDFVFIDGNHTYEGMLRDAKNAISMNAKYLGFDDYYHPAHSKDCHKIVEELGLEMVIEYKNYTGQALTINPNHQ
tara:strand:- start:1932 stop:2486 length:555 start_codon:yes stop_codon:yes gene_type:complete